MPSQQPMRLYITLVVRWPYKTSFLKKPIQYCDILCGSCLEIWVSTIKLWKHLARVSTMDIKCNLSAIWNEAFANTILLWVEFDSRASNRIYYYYTSYYQEKEQYNDVNMNVTELNWCLIGRDWVLEYWNIKNISLVHLQWRYKH